MFKKKPTIKTLSPLRSSDRRKIADKIISDFGLQPSNNESKGETQDGANNTLSTLRKALLPDNALSAKFTTTSGPQLQEVNGLVYVGSYGSSEQRVLWVKINETMYPSVYTLWRNPRILPLLHTPAFVVGKLKGGADLMTPGLAGPPFPDKAKKGSLAAVASLEEPSVPIAVGTCVIDVASLKTTQGVKGPAVETFHWAGDDLWDWSTSGRPGVAAPAEIPAWLADQESHLAEATADINLKDDDEEEEEDAGGGVALEKEAPPAPRNEHVEGEDAVREVVDPGGGASEMTTQELDDTFLNAFLFGVHQQKQNNPRDSKYGLKFPLTQSFVMSNLVLPFLPAFTAEQATAMQIKKTSWKNPRKFIMALGNKKVVLTKEMKNEAIIRDIDFDDILLRDFTPYRLPKKESPNSQPANGQSGPSSANGADDAIGQALKIETLYRPQSGLSNIFKNGQSSKGPYYEATRVRAAVTRYIEDNNLVQADNKRMVTLDPEISNAVLTTSNPTDRDMLAKGRIPRDTLIERVKDSCQPFHVILRNGQTLESTDAKPKAGLPPKIGIIMETRGGNKTATRVHELETYSINPQLLADELRKVCAGSTSVEPFKGGKGMEVMVQGPQKDAVIKALEKRGVNSKWVEVTDKTKKKK